MKRSLRLSAIAALALALIGCSSGGGSGFNVCSAVTTVRVQQVAIETAAMSFIAMTKAGTIDPSLSARAAMAYNTWADSQRLLVTSLVAINDSGGDPSTVSIQTYAQLAIQVAVLAADFIAIYEMSRARTPAMSLQNKAGLSAAQAEPCTITDDQINVQLTVPTWVALGGA